MRQNFLKPLVMLIGFSALMSCVGNVDKSVAKKAGVALPMPIIPSQVSAPVVTPLSAMKPPVVIKVGAPVVQKDYLEGLGPFFTNFSTEDGIGGSTVNCIYQDKLGDMWFATQGGGLNRYDGKNFTGFTTAQGLAANAVTCTIQDRNGDIWIGTAGGGLSRFDGRSFKNYGIPEGLGSNIVADILEEKNGHLLVLSQSGPITEFDGDKFNSVPLPTSLISAGINCMLQDKTGKFWFGTNEKGVIVYDGHNSVQLTKAQGLADNSIQGIIEDKADNIWLSTYAGVSKYDGKKFTNYTQKEGLSNYSFPKIIQDGYGNIWFSGSGKGITRFDGKIFVNYTKKQGLADDDVEYMYVDNNGSIWLAYKNGGAGRFDLKGFTQFSPQQGQVGTFGNGIMQDNAGNIWFGTSNGGVIRYNGRTFDRFGTEQGLSGNTVHGMILDRQGNIWFGTDGGATKYDGHTFTNYNHDQGLLINHGVYGVMQDRLDNIWFGTWGGGVDKFDGKSFTRYTTKQGLAFNIVDVMTEDKAGNIWFGSGKGVSKFDGKKFINYTKDHGLESNIIISVMRDKANNLWFGSDEGGVSRFDGKTFLNNSTTNWVDANNEIFSIKEDIRRNMVWFGTTHGLSWIKPAKNGNSFTTDTFDSSLGYPLKSVFALMVDQNDVLWAGCSDNKIIRIDYNEISKRHAPVNLQITGIKINDNDMCWNNLIPGSGSIGAEKEGALLTEMETTFGKRLAPFALKGLRDEYRGIQFDSIKRFYPVPVNLQLPYINRNVTIDYIAIAPDWPKRVKYTYKLIGYDKAWSPLSSNTSAVFGNIPEGTYTFYVKAMSPAGELAHAEYSFNVLPPWYRTWWAWILYVCAFAGTIGYFVTLRSRQLLKQKRVLEHTVKIRTGEVVTQKEEIELQRNELEKAFYRLENTQSQLIQAEKMASLGQLTTGIAHEIQNPLNFINNFSDVNTEIIEEIADELRLGNTEEAIAILAELRENEKKINHHGHRVDSIVKGMLAHGRAGGSVKEKTDMNKLVEDSIRLAYQQFRTKYPHLTAELVIEADKNLPQVELIMVDMSRVLLNLFSNAFYAVTEKKKNAADDYLPTVKVATTTQGNNIKIMISDNGTGIPVDIRDKIMQPFFTTKPTGEGVGMGLSLAYDIVVNGYKGSLFFENTGEGSVFFIILPLNLG